MVEKLVQAKMPKIVGRKKDDISEKDEFSLPQIVSSNPRAACSSTREMSENSRRFLSDPITLLTA